MTVTDLQALQNSQADKTIMVGLHHCPTASRCGPKSTPHRESGGPRGCQYEHGDTGDLIPIQLGRPVEKRTVAWKSEKSCVQEVVHAQEDLASITVAKLQTL